MIRLKILNESKKIELKCNFKFPNISKGILQEKEVIPTKEMQEIEASAGYTGLSKVIVDKIPDEYIIPNGTIEINQNGNYDVTDKQTASVNIPEQKLGTKLITENGTYKAVDDDLDGYSEVEVSTSGVDINDYMGGTIPDNRLYTVGSWVNIIKKLLDNVTISGTSASQLFYGLPCEEVPMIDISNVTNTASMFSNAQKIKTIPLLNTSKVTNMYQMFYSCVQLQSIPLIDTSNVTNMENMFYRCLNLTSIPLLDMGKVITTYYMFYTCAIIEIPQINTENVENMGRMFWNCTNLEKVPELNCQSVTSIDSTFRTCSNLETLGGLLNLGQAYLTTQSANYSNYKLDLSAASKLTHDSLMDVINKIYDIATKGVATQQIVLGSTNIAKLTAEEIAIATEKGWTVS